MAENGVATTNPHFDTTRISNERMIRAEKARAEMFNKLVDRVTAIEMVVEFLLARDGTSIQELVELGVTLPVNEQVSEGTGEEMKEVTGELAGDLVTDGTGEILTPVVVDEGEGFDPDRRRVINEMGDTVDAPIQEPVSI